MFVLLLATVATATPAPAAPPPAQVMAEVDRLAARPLWPGFDPRRMPVAIFDGERTWLFRHPRPPQGFARATSAHDAWVFPGRHPALTANTSVELGGVPTATALLAPTEGATLPERAALVIHECFHIFQDARHPGWSANEAVLFTYPLGYTQALALRRLETAALRRAVLAEDTDEAASWATAALAARHARYLRLPAEATGYERSTELHEGLASYVEGRALGRARADVLPAADFPAEETRRRAYRTGEALALLLDRFDSAWRNILEGGDQRALDELLLDALARSGAQAADFDDEEREAAWQRAADDVATLAKRHELARAEFLARPGWRVVVVSAGAPLMPAGFDPWNVSVLGPGEVLHTRWLKLANPAGTVEVLEHPSLSVAAGAHPLFSGVARLTVTGLEHKPIVGSHQGALTVTAPGFSLTLAGAHLERAGQTLTVTLAR